jgi:hypothetical protein
MTKEEYVALAEQKYEELQSLGEIDNFYDYEKEFEKIFDELARAVLQKNLSEVPADRRKKNAYKIWIYRDKQGSPPSAMGPAGGFQISPLLQELMVYLGQLDCYQKGPEILQKTIGVEVGHSQSTAWQTATGSKRVTDCRPQEPWLP